MWQHVAHKSYHSSFSAAWQVAFNPVSRLFRWKLTRNTCVLSISAKATSFISPRQWSCYWHFPPDLLISRSCSGAQFDCIAKIAAKNPAEFWDMSQLLAVLLKILLRRKLSRAIELPINNLAEILLLWKRCWESCRKSLSEVISAAQSNWPPGHRDLSPVAQKMPQVISNY